MFCGDGQSLKTRENTLKKTLSKTPDLVPIQLEYARLLYSQKKFNLGDSLVDIVISKQPENYIAYFIKGLGRLLDENYYDAEYYFRHSLTINKFYQPCVQNLAFVLIKKGNENELMALCQRHHEIDPYNSVLNSYLGFYYYQNNNNQKALYFLEFAEKNTNAQTDISEIQLKLAEIYYDKGDYYNSAEYYTKALKKVNEYSIIVKSWLQLRQCYIQLGDEKKRLAVETWLKSKNINFENNLNIY